MGAVPHCEEFGREFRSRRLEADIGLREFCRANGFDAAYVSRIERGRVKPPTEESLAQYLEAIGLERDGEEWKDLNRLACACAGEVPAELMSDEEVVRKLPVVFRALGNKEPTREEIEDLIEIIRRA